ncbi:MAG TPA: hypothetical protein VFW78_12660 [Bacteroidia bacterium]|nr:hypothetical protein [Bacteroidia bacterium]
MKKIVIICFVFVAAALQSKAQIQINPQLGLTIMNFTDPPEGVDFEANVGFMVGGDVRIGEKFQFQPGAF